MGGALGVKYLLDTHIWIWSVSNPGNLSNKVRNILENESNELFISSISIWEFLVLLEKKRITIANPLDEWLSRATDESNIIDIPIDKEIAVQSRKIVMPHQDPADRFIAATALVNELKLITSDGILGKSEEISIVFNKA